MTRCLTGLMLLAVAACAGDAEQPREKEILKKLESIRAALDKDKENANDRQKLAMQIREHIKTAKPLLLEFEKKYPKSKLLAKVRSATLYIFSASPDVEMKDQAVALATTLKDIAEKGSDPAAQADLILLDDKLTGFLKDATNAKEQQELWTKNSDTIHKAIEDYLTAYPRYEPALEFLAQIASMAMDMEAVKTRTLILERVAKEFPNHQLAKEYRREKAVGTVIDFAFKPNGSTKETSLKDLRGKVVVIDFWATWCGPCKAELPGLKKLYEKYEKEGLAVIGVSLDDDDREKLLVEYVKENNITWPQVVGPTAMEFADRWGIVYIPVVFVIDRQGKLRSAQARGKLDKLVPELLAEK